MTIEWKLLVFLILFLDLKLAMKGLALVFVYCVQPDFNFGIRRKNSRLPLFYLILIGIGLFNLPGESRLTGNYALVVFAGILIWAACFLAIHQIRLFVDKTDTRILHQTILVFFLLNILFSLLDLLMIWAETGIRNPFLYQGQYQKYFINTGDYIKGISFDSSTTNAVINGFGVIYFLFRRHYALVLACMCTLLLTASNFCNAVLVLILLFIFICKASREQKSIIAICFMLLVFFMVAVSPQNDQYILTLVNRYVLHKPEDLSIHRPPVPIRVRPDSLLTFDTRREKIATLALDSMKRIEIVEHHIAGTPQVDIPLVRPVIPGDSIHTASFQWRRDTTAFQRTLQNYILQKNIQPETPISGATAGKIQSFRQSILFLKDHRSKIISGDGIGNFSSSLAYRATGLKIAGGFPAGLTYSNADFLRNHFSLYAFFFSKNAESHSIIHNPASVYDQLLTEYGFAGLAAFLFCYLGFFLKDIKKLSYGLPLLAFLLAVFLADYWFEQLSVVVLFELLFFVNRKEANENLYDV